MDDIRMHEWLDGSMGESMLHEISGEQDDLGDNFEYIPDNLSGPYQRRPYEAGSDSEEIEITDSSDEEPPDLVPEDIHAGSRKSHKLPTWFDNKPFQYNGRVFFVSLPGVLIALSLGGDLIISVLTMGILVVYLLQGAGESHKALIAFVVTFVCCQMTIMYSALPMLWLSLFNFVLLSSLNMFTVLTGGWLSLQFDEFKLSEPDFCRVIESMLFSIYPPASVVLMTWLLTIMTSSNLTPYFAMILGFVVLQFFLTPTQSSFFKYDPNNRDDISRLILDPVYIGAIALAFGVTPTFMFSCISMVKLGWKIFSFSVLVEGTFISCLSIFLSTLLPVKTFFEHEGLSAKYLLQMRWISGMVSLLLLSTVLQKYDIYLYLLPWLSIGVAAHAVYGFLVSDKQNKIRSLVGAILLCGLYTFLFTKLPWVLKIPSHYLSDSSVHVSHAHILLLSNIFACIVCTYLGTYASTDAFGFALLMQTNCMVLLEKLLLNSKLYHVSVMIPVTVFSIYLILRLHAISKLNWKHAWMCSSLHFTKIADCCELLAGYSYQFQSSVAYGAFHFSAVFCLALILTKIIVFESSKSLSFQQCIFYLVSVTIVIILNAHSLLSSFVWLLLREQAGVPDFMALNLLVTGLVALKLHLFHEVQWKHFKFVGPTLLVAAMLVIQLQPKLQVSWTDFVKWLVILSILGCFTVVPLATVLKSSLLLYCLGTSLGVPVGLGLATWLYPSGIPLMYYSLYAILGALCFTLALLVWKDVQKLDTHVIILCAFLAPTSIGIIVINWVWLLKGELFQPGILAVATAASLSAIILKLQAYRGPVSDLNRLAESRGKDKTLPVLGNTATFVAFVTLVCLCPVEAWELWVIACSASLLLLQKDSVFLAGLNRQNNILPCVLVTIMTLLGSSLNESIFWQAETIFQTLRGIMELITILAVLPSYYILVTVIWRNEFYISDKYVVFLAPINTVLYLVGNSYVSIGYATFGIMSSLWMTKYKLPLLIEFEDDYR